MPRIAAPRAGSGGRTMSTWLRRIVLLLLVGGALGAIVYAGTLGTGSEEIRRTDEAVERLVPEDGSPVAVRQAEVGVDLAPGWTGVLKINGIEIPEDQLRRVEAQNEVYFQPGTIVVEAEIWRSASETRADARTVTWRFGVA